LAGPLSLFYDGYRVVSRGWWRLTGHQLRTPLDYADIPACLFRLPIILGTEGFCKPFSTVVDGDCSCSREAEKVRPSFLGGGVCSSGTNWRSSFQSAALEVATRSMPRWSRIPQAIFKEVPVADGYLAVWTRKRMAAGAQLKPAGGTLGAVHCSSRRRSALYSLRLLWTGSAFRSLVIYGLLTCPGDVRFRSGGQSERTRDVMNLKLLFDGDGRRQDPTHTLT
jgi:hypothetical protein